MNNNNTYTDRFETVIPDALRRRYRVPCQKPHTEQSLKNESSGNSQSFVESVQIKPPQNGNGFAPKPKVDWEALKNTPPDLPILPVLPNITPPLPKPSAKPSLVWFSLGVAFALVVSLVALGEIHLHPTSTSTPAPTPTPVPVVTPTPEPTPFSQASLDEAVRSVLPEVRRAEPVAGNVLYTGQVPMPYGGTQAVRVLGVLPNQEALPALGATIGDAYVIGRYLFVWVAPGGVGQWIDPVIQ